MKCPVKGGTLLPKADYNSTVENYDSPSVLWKNGWRYICGVWITNSFWLSASWPFWGDSCLISIAETDLLQINSAFVELEEEVVFNKSLLEHPGMMKRPSPLSSLFDSCLHKHFSCNYSSFRCFSERITPGKDAHWKIVPARVKDLTQ